MVLPDSNPLLREAYDASARIDMAAVLTGRAVAQAAFLYDSVGTFDLGIQVAADNEAYQVTVHLPDVNALVPPDSPIDALFKASPRGLRPKVKRQLWGRHFDFRNKTVPALSLSFMIREDGDSLAIGAPTVAHTALSATYRQVRALETSAAISSQTSAHIREPLLLAGKLAAQRARCGTTDVFHKGHLWVPSKDRQKFQQGLQGHLLRREFGKAAGVSAGSALAEQGTPAIFSHLEPTPDPSCIADIVQRMFDRTLSMDEADAALRAFRMVTDPIYTQPDADSHNAPHIQLLTAKHQYPGLLNTRIVAAMSHGETLYTAKELVPFTTSRQSRPA